MNEHTKGPWKKGDKFTCDSDTVERYIITGPDGRTVAEVGLWLDKIEEQEANATLIETTPDLLEACKLLRHRLWTRRTKFSDQDHDAMNAGSAAIVKAEPNVNDSENTVSP